MTNGGSAGEVADRAGSENLRDDSDETGVRRHPTRRMDATHTGFVDTRTSFVEAFERKARSTPDAAFARWDGKTLTFGDIARDSATLAAYLTGMGIGQGERVAVMMHNSDLQVKVIVALARAGIVWVPINARQRGKSLGYVLKHCEPSAIICDDTLLHEVQETGVHMAPSRLVISVREDDGATSLERLLARPVPFSAPAPAASDVFAIMYTSGTTGRPKGVLVSYAMMSYAAEAVGQVASVEDGDVMFLWEPLYHIGGAQVLLLPMIRDVTLAMVERFSASSFWNQVRSSGATHVHYLGGILQILLKQPADSTDRDHGVRIFWGGGCKREQWRPFEERFGVGIRECYGMTEASSITTCNEAGAVGSVGTPVPWFAVEIVDGDGLPTRSGEQGEIVVRPLAEGAISTGYFRDPDATARTVRDGILYTGDIGSFDTEGNLLFHGRMSDSVRCRGENVSAWEVEHVAAAHPAIEDCAMVGVAADVGEHDIKLFVQLRPGRQLELADLTAWLAVRLAPYQVPRYFARVDRFERTPSERIMKHLLSRTPQDEWDNGQPG